MASKKETLRNTAYDLIYTGIGGEMKQGDLFSFWTFNENPDTQQFALTEWKPEQRQALANQAYAFLKNQPFQKISRFDKALGEILLSTQESASLTIVILGDGLEFVRGTPFNHELNTAYSERSPELRRSDKPFITVLQAKQGLVVGWSIAAVGEPVRIPAIPASPQSVQTKHETILAEEPAFIPREVLALPAQLSASDPVPTLIQRESISPLHSGTVTTPAVIAVAGPAEDLVASSSGRIEKPPAGTEKSAATAKGTDQEGGPKSLETIPSAPDLSSPVTTLPSSDPGDPAKKTHSIETNDHREETLLARDQSMKASKAAPGNSNGSVSVLSSTAVSLERNDPVNVKASPGITVGSERAPTDPLVRGGALVPQEAIVVPIARGHMRWEYLSLALVSILAASGLIYFRLRRSFSAPPSSLISSSASRNAHGKPPFALPPHSDHETELHKPK